MATPIGKTVGYWRIPVACGRGLEVATGFRTEIGVLHPRSRGAPPSLDLESLKFR